MSSQNYLTIDLSMIQHNLRELKALAKGRTYFAVLKANAYGLGAVPIARAIQDQVDFFCVAIPEEAETLVKSGIRLPILVLGYLPEEWMPYYLEHQIRPAIYSQETAETFNALAMEKGVTAPVHLAIDTGHSRIGYQWNDPDLIEKIGRAAALDHLHIEGTFSHYARADEEDPSFMTEQRERFRAVCRAMEEAGISPGIRHIANDPALLRDPASLFDGVRTGISLYGEWASPYIKSQKLADIRPVFSWSTAVIHVKMIEEGTPVGYGSSWVAPRPSRIATLQVGYADGYPRSLSNRGMVLIHGKSCPIRGRVCMDQVMVDVTGIKDVKAGDRAILLGPSEDGKQAITTDQLASWAGSFNYELMTQISSRVSRKYLPVNRSQ